MKAATSIKLLISTILIVLFFTNCEKIEPIVNNSPDEVEFTCESCHTNGTVLALLAPDTGDAGGGGG